MENPFYESYNIVFIKQKHMKLTIIKFLPTKNTIGSLLPVIYEQVQSYKEINVQLFSFLQSIELTYKFHSHLTTEKKLTRFLMNAQNLKLYLNKYESEIGGISNVTSLCKYYYSQIQINFKNKF